MGSVSEQDKLPGLLEHVVEQIAIGVDEGYVRDPEVDFGGAQPEIAQVVGVEGEGPKYQVVEFS